MRMIDTFAILLALGLLLTSTAPLLSRAQEPGKAAVRGITELIKLREIREDLAVADFQNEKIDQALAELKAANIDFAQTLQGTSRERRAVLIEEFKTRSAKVEADIAAALLPEQLQRLKQIRMNLIVVKDGATYGLNNREFLEELGLTDAQRGEIDAKAAEVQKVVQEKVKKLQAEIDKIKLEARDDVIQILTPDQRKKYLDLVGRPYAPNPGQ